MPAVNEGASSGVTFSTINVGGTDYRVARIESAGTLVVSEGGDFEWLGVGGGGPGGSATTGFSGCGGGGAGGFRKYVTGEANNTEGSPLTLGANSYAITVGDGGMPSRGAGSNGQDTTISGPDISTLTCVGGGRGGAEDSIAAASGGSGGGGAFTASTPGSGASGQGNSGASNNNTPAGGGGGGAGAAGLAEMQKALGEIEPGLAQLSHIGDGGLETRGLAGLQGDEGDAHGAGGEQSAARPPGGPGQVGKRMIQAHDLGSCAIMGGKPKERSRLA